MLQLKQDPSLDREHITDMIKEIGKEEGYSDELLLELWNENGPVNMDAFIEYDQLIDFVEDDKVWQVARDTFAHQVETPHDGAGAGSEEGKKEEPVVVEKKQEARTPGPTPFFTKQRPPKVENPFHKAL